MKVVFNLTYILGLMFIVGESSRRGIDYWAINASTLIEDYLCGGLLLLAALLWLKKHNIASKLMAAAWGYATGAMFVPFFGHLEAWLRGITFRDDHPHADIESVVLKGIIWALCLACLIVTLRSNDVRSGDTKSSAD